jgi:hypothetical protein
VKVVYTVMFREIQKWNSVVIIRGVATEGNKKKQVKANVSNV